MTNITEATTNGTQLWNGIPNSDELLTSQLIAIFLTLLAYFTARFAPVTN
jgi:hypothetical protein